MNSNILRSSVAALALGATVFTATSLPAKADTTTNDILLGAAAAAGIFTAVNVEHKHQIATTVQGYLPDGSTVYEDGHVVSPNGRSWYPGNNGQSVACNNQYCTINGNGRYGYNGYNGSNGYNGYNGYNGNNGRYSNYNDNNNGNRYNNYNGNRYNNYNGNRNGNWNRNDNDDNGNGNGRNRWHRNNDDSGH